MPERELEMWLTSDVALMKLEDEHCGVVSCGLTSAPKSVVLKMFNIDKSVLFRYFFGP
jgi:hypothetical protein